MENQILLAKLTLTTPPTSPTVLALIAPARETASLRTQLAEANARADDAEARSALIDEAQDANAGLVRKLAERDALIEKAVEALGEAGETLQWIGEARLGLSGPGDGKDRKADAEDIFGVYATLDRLAKLRADLTAAIGKGDGT